MISLNPTFGNNQHNSPALYMEGENRQDKRTQTQPYIMHGSGVEQAANCKDD